MANRERADVLREQALINAEKELGELRGTVRQQIATIAALESALAETQVAFAAMGQWRDEALESLAVAQRERDEWRRSAENEHERAEREYEMVDDVVKILIAEGRPANESIPDGVKRLVTDAKWFVNSIGAITRTNDPGAPVRMDMETLRVKVEAVRTQLDEAQRERDEARAEVDRIKAAILRTKDTITQNAVIAQTEYDTLRALLQNAAAWLREGGDVRWREGRARQIDAALKEE